MQLTKLFLLLVMTVTVQAVEFPLSGRGLAGDQLQIDPIKRERPVLVVFWASWCSVCVREMPSLRQFHASLGERMDLIACTIDTDVDAARDCAAQNQLGYPTIFDGDMAIADKFSIDATPTMVLMSAGGHELARGRSLSQLSDALANLGVVKP